MPWGNTSLRACGWRLALPGSQAWSQLGLETRVLAPLGDLLRARHPPTSTQGCEREETARRSNQSILKEISPEYSLEGLMLKLVFWLLDAKSWPIGKDPDYGKDWGQKEKGTTEDEMVGWHHWLSRHEFGKLWEIVEGSLSWTFMMFSNSWYQKIPIVISISWLH